MVAVVLCVPIWIHAYQNRSWPKAGVKSDKSPARCLLLYANWAGGDSRDAPELWWNTFLQAQVSRLAHQMVLKLSAWCFSAAQHKLIWETSQS